MRFKVIVAYNGAPYYGWQTQHRGDSVQESIENVLSGMHGEHIEIVASGRTDAKVHAIGQVFHFDSTLNITCEAMKIALNSQLPKDIRIQSVEVVNDQFHARFDACSKRYDYYLSTNVSNPFIENFMAYCTVKLDVDAMRECASIFIGEHDFTSFTSARIDERKSRIKEIIRCEIIQEKDVIHFIIEGTGFLRYMVRMIVQTIIEVGKNKVSSQEVEAMLVGKNKHLCKYKAPAQGLYLVEVKYECK